MCGVLISMGLRTEYVVLLLLSHIILAHAGQEHGAR